MKYLFSTLFVLLSCTFGFAQCSISGPSELNVGQTGTFSLSSTFAQCGSCYDWDIIGGSGTINRSDMGNSVSITKNSTANLVIRVTALRESGCASCQKTVTTTGSCSQYSVIMNDLYLQGGNFVYLIANTTPSNLIGASYNWRVAFGNGGGFQIYNTTTSYVEVPLNFGQTIISCRVTVNYQGCIFTDDVTFNPPISGGGGGPFEDLDGELPQPSLEKQDIKVFPNPTTGELNFTGIPLDGFTVTIMDSQGRQVISQNPIDQRLSISDYPTGIYHFIINNANGVVKSGKIIKE